jgi:histidine triad (HIT) family protein
LNLRTYLKDLAELVGIPTQTEVKAIEETKAEELPLTVFDRIVRREIPATIIYEDDKALAFKDANPVAPVHFIVVPKNKEGLITLAEMKEQQANLLGHMMLVAGKVAEEQGCK